MYEAPVRRAAWIVVVLLLTLVATTNSTVAEDPVVLSEFVYESAPFPSCHAATIAETPQGLIAAWFGGQDEGDPSVGIWVARREPTGWTAPQEVANGLQATGGTRYPTWNPVLFVRRDGTVLLYYKEGPRPSQWWGKWIQSADQGRTWSSPERLPDGILGPIKNKPVSLANGRWVSGSSTEDQGWRVHFEWSDDQGRSWRATPPINRGNEFGLIQPTLFITRGGHQVAYMRSRQGKIVESRSADQGETWTAPVATALPNPNSGIDGVTLADGRHALIYNHTARGRSPLNLALAADDTFDWRPALTLESDPGEYSYPAILQTSNGLLHMAYTWKRQRIKHVVVDLQRLRP